MDSENNMTLMVTALGRPFSIGMLYDCRHDTLVPGLSLWNREHLLKHMGERPQNYSDFEIVASDSTEDKASALNIGGSLKLSILSGMVEVEGSAKYLKNNKKSKNQVRVTLKYEATTKVQELSMDHLAVNNLDHEDILQKGVATHVVTAILYGVQAFFVFDREASEDEDCQEIEGSFKGALKKLPKVSIEGEGALHMEDKHSETAEQFSCKYHGDFFLEHNPVTFVEAVKVYQSLPKLLEANMGNVVPLKVWLLPLTYFDSHAAKLVCQIREDIVHRAQCVLEDITDLEMRCNDALKTHIAQQFPEISKNLKTFNNVCFNLKVKFQQTLAKKLPSVRGGDEEESGLATNLKKYEHFLNKANLHKWMDCQEKEISFLTSIREKLEKMKNTKILPSENDLYREILTAEKAVCFVFNSKGRTDSYLSDLSNYLNKTEPDLERAPMDSGENKQWFFSKEVFNEVRNAAKQFTEVSGEDGKLLAVVLTDETSKNKGASIHRYEDGDLLGEETVRASNICKTLKGTDKIV